MGLLWQICGDVGDIPSWMDDSPLSKGCPPRRDLHAVIEFVDEVRASRRGMRIRAWSMTPGISPSRHPAIASARPVCKEMRAQITNLGYSAKRTKLEVCASWSSHGRQVSKHLAIWTSLADKRAQNCCNRGSTARRCCASFGCTRWRPDPKMNPIVSPDGALTAFDA